MAKEAECWRFHDAHEDIWRLQDEARWASDKAFTKFMDLPLEIRVQIYGWMIGNQTIHVEHERRHFNSLMLFRCKTTFSEPEFCQQYFESIANDVGTLIWPLEWDWDVQHESCYVARDLAQRYGETLESYRGLDFRMDLLTVSSEVRREVTELFYATNTFSFKDSSVPDKFLTKVPSDIVFRFKKLRLEMRLGGNILDRSSTACDWATCVKETIAKRFAGLTSLSLTILLGGYVTCWRESQGQLVTDMFRALRQLKHLRDFNVIILEDLIYYPFQRTCDQVHHNKLTHLSHDRTLDRHNTMSDEDRRENHQQSKELMGQWAKDIQEVVLSKEEETIEGVLQGLSMR